MAIRLILLLGAMLLSCGSAGLLIVRLTNPRLSGLGWLGGAFAAGGIGAVLLATERSTPDIIGCLLADLLILSAFVLVHVAVLELSERGSLLPKFGIFLLVLQGAFDLCLMAGYGASILRTEAACVLIALQVAQTALQLIRFARQGIRAAAWFSAGILVCFTVFNLVRSGLLAFGGAGGRRFAQDSIGVIYSVYIIVGLGIAFGFFWMTTAVLTLRLEQQASTDSLTRVFNRRYFLKWCEQEQGRSRRSGSSFSILMVDIDHFKQINDTFGHSAGDTMICTVIEKMQDAVRGIDVIGRWGGEEFVVLLPGASADSAQVVAHRMRSNVEKIGWMELDLQAGGKQAERKLAVGVTVSVGVATSRDGEDSIAEILGRADQAMYEAKSQGRNCVCTAI
ncbi:GGDEF domain-containing protein [Granulicella sp. WH15]|uniref:GGDEF domain-containing protein n=1 Tax=Granulicella sp. WH15 TaxID=2602070 RepID=UPI0013678FBB|nr:GGDEF domain-containing protein [Granulicella sp. WH15]QHN04664.1 GGDEF domain-containing protein [Granulicella sp. WH15]